MFSCLSPPKFVTNFALQTSSDAIVAKCLYKYLRLARYSHKLISSPYEVPEQAEITVDTSKYTLNECVDHIMKELQTCVIHELGNFGNTPDIFCPVIFFKAKILIQSHSYIVSIQKHTGSKIVFDRFSNNKPLGSFILIDRISHATAAGGVVMHPLSRGNNLKWQEMDITREIAFPALTENSFLPPDFFHPSITGTRQIANLLPIQHPFAEHSPLKYLP